MKERNRIWFVLGLIILFGGLNLTILLSHLSRYFGIVLIGLGLAIIFLTTRTEDRPKKKVEPAKTIGTRLIALFTVDGRVTPYFPFLGIALVAFVAVFNIYISHTAWLGSNDYITLILAGVLIAYNHVPKNYSVERDFALIFISFLFLILAVPTTVYAATSSTAIDTNSVTNNSITRVLLTAPTAALSQLFGVEFADIGNNTMHFSGPSGENINLIINLSCTGLYSVAIFISAFIAFVSVEYSKFDNKVLKLLALGILFAWIANIIRMTIIVLVGKHYGSEAMRWTHNNIGEIIFMIWVSIFWLVMFKYLKVWEDITPEAKKARPVKPRYDPKKKYTRKCSVCETTLSPTIPAYLCKCGEIYHRECIEDMKNCTGCHRVFQK